MIVDITTDWQLVIMPQTLDHTVKLYIAESAVNEFIQIAYQSTDNVVAALNQGSTSWIDVIVPAATAVYARSLNANARLAIYSEHPRALKEAGERAERRLMQREEIIPPPLEEEWREEKRKVKV